jgi:hypothetical protein
MGPDRGMPNVAVFDLEINPDASRLVAFTYGRGAFMLPLSPSCPSIICPPSQSVPAASTAGAVVNYPLPTAGDNCPGLTVVCNFRDRCSPSAPDSHLHGYGSIRDPGDLHIYGNGHRSLLHCGQQHKR